MNKKTGDGSSVCFSPPFVVRFFYGWSGQRLQLPLPHGKRRWLNQFTVALREPNGDFVGASPFPVCQKEVDSAIRILRQPAFPAVFICRKI